MTFAAPWSLVWFAALPVVVAGYVVLRGRRRQRSAALAAQGLTLTGAARTGRFRPHVPFALVVGALALSVVGFARPMASIKTPKREATVVLAMDVSNSMGAKDVAPSRLGAAKAAATAFVREQPSSVRIGVVAFGPSAVIVQHPTSDHAAALQAIKSLALGGGTSISAGILTALDDIAGKTIKVDTSALGDDDSNEVSIGFYGGATIVLFSDGEDTSGSNPSTMARLASVAGVRIQAIGVGSPAGTTVEIDGFSVATALDAATLQSVAKVTNGAYYQVDDASSLAAVSKTINLHFTIVTEYTQVSALFAAGAGILLLIGALLSVRWFGRVV